MTYVMSDIHGDYERYMKMLEAINLDEDRDTLYVLGDVIDFGDAGMKILDDMSSRPNVYPIIGEHEYTALPLLRRLCGDAEESAVAVAALGSACRLCRMGQERRRDDRARIFRALARGPRMAGGLSRRICAL